MNARADLHPHASSPFASPRFRTADQWSSLRLTGAAPGRIEVAGHRLFADTVRIAADAGADFGALDFLKAAIAHSVADRLADCLCGARPSGDQQSISVSLVQDQDVGMLGLITIELRPSPTAAMRATMAAALLAAPPCPWTGIRFSICII
jgi:hypothetical protein